LKTEELIRLYAATPQVMQMVELLKNQSTPRIFLKGLAGSSPALIKAAVFHLLQRNHLVILNDAESAAYLYNDLETLFHEKGEPYEHKNTLFFPTVYKRHFEFDRPDRTNMLMRSEVLSRIVSSPKKAIIVSYTEALTEKVVRKKVLTKNTLKLKVGEKVTLDFIADVLNEYGFDREDFVYEPGQFSIRGGILDVFSYAHDNPFRVEFFGEMVESIRSFDPASQLSIDKMDRITILPDLSERLEVESRESFLSFLPVGAMIWTEDLTGLQDLLDLHMQKLQKLLEDDTAGIFPANLKEHFVGKDEFLGQLLEHAIVESGSRPLLEPALQPAFDTRPQPSFNKNFDLLTANLEENTRDGISNYILSENPRQIERIYTILEDLMQSRQQPREFAFSTFNISLHEGFIDRQLNLALYTDHQIFERYHKFYLKDSYSSREAITLKELYNLNPGDYVTHIDHGIGRYDGLEKIDVNGRQQEAIRIIYKNSDLLYISIHSLHRISKYIGKEGTEPKLDRLGSNAWNKLKIKTKNRVKDIAKELIQLYAQRKNAEGFPFLPDTYLQTELEASFIYEDTPDQVKATADVKADMEKSFPMDRLICGDVGFGKTEIAIRAAFKAVTDSKQVAVLVPTTILALQHYKTFSDRLKDFPCSVDYINRFKSQQKQKETLKKIAEGKLDILIGTHRLISQDVKFKDLGLLIIDEEQKFGVGAKEKLKQLRVNVDTLTLTATPIPRTLQFSLMGARDLSIINTAPPNRYPIQTEVRTFSEEVIREAIIYEVSRGGQVFFVHNRVLNIHDVERMLQKFLPNITIGVAHGQMDGTHLENIMLDFIDGVYDVLLATTIIESGLDIPNVNTIIINDAHHFGLSDLHQLRGRVGRSNRKAFCYLLAPPVSVLTDEARKRLKAIEEFSDLGSGFNIAMRDLDIRGAGNILGAEQSGFISEIGFEMYHKILDEALQELKDAEFSELFKDEKPKPFVKDCQIETDLEILIPGDYISNSTERLIIYKELDSMETEEGLVACRQRIIDRFGTIPKQTEELLNTIRLRWLAKKAGFEKIVLKNERFIGYFISNQDSPYYQSEDFAAMLRFVQSNPSICRMKENETRLSLTFKNVRSVKEAIRLLKGLEGA
jgi:transcription-repair coupling factor (superfamily II helicase)